MAIRVFNYGLHDDTGAAREYPISKKRGVVSIIDVFDITYRIQSQEHANVLLYLHHERRASYVMFSIETPVPDFKLFVSLSQRNLGELVGWELNNGLHLERACNDIRRVAKLRGITEAFDSEKFKTDLRRTLAEILLYIREVFKPQFMKFSCRTKDSLEDFQRILNQMPPPDIYTIERSKQKYQREFYLTDKVHLQSVLQALHDAK